MHSRPNPGQRVTVLMRDGTQLHDCCATMIYVADRAGIVIYNKRKAVDESLAKGWWPVTPNAELFGGPPGPSERAQGYASATKTG